MYKVKYVHIVKVDNEEWQTRISILRQQASMVGEHPRRATCSIGERSSGPRVRQTLPRNPVSPCAK